MSPLVSVLIPMYNAEAWIASTLRCVCSQTWPHLEAIVVDDGSTDGSLEIAREFERAKVKVIHQENQGACAARNRALRYAQGDYIQYLDADDLMEADKIELQMERLATVSSRTVAAAPWARFYKEIGDGPHPPIPKVWPHENPIDWLIAERSGNGMMPPLGWLTPRELVEEAGPWDESLLRNQDGEYFTRVLQHADQIVFCPEACVYYRSGLPNSVSGRRSPEAVRSSYRAARSIIQVMRRLEDSPRVRQACAYFMQGVVYEAYPHVPDVVRKAEKEVSTLGGSARTPKGGQLFRWFGKAFGWKAALALRYFYRQLV